MARLGEPLAGRELLSIPLDDYISNVAFSPNGKYFMMAPTSHQGTRMWEVMSGEKLTLPFKSQGAFAFSPDGERLAIWTPEGSVHVWVGGSDSVGTPLPCEACKGVVAHLAFSPDSRWLATATGGDTFVQVWDVAKKKEVARVVPGRGPVAFSPNDRLLAAWTDDNTITIWEIAPEPEMAQLGLEVASEPEMNEKIGISAVAFAPDGTWLAAGGGEHTVQVWEATTGRTLAQVKHPSGMELRVSLSPHGRWLATLDENGRMRVWEVTTEQPMPELVSEGPVHAISFSPDGTQLAAASGNGVQVRVVETGKLVAEVPHEGRVGTIAFRPDRRQLATGDERGTVQVWDFKTKKVVAYMAHERVIAVAFSPDGQWLATAGNDQTVRVWDVATEREIAYVVHEGAVRAIAFSSDGKWLATGSADPDRTARLWEAATGQPLARMDHGGNVEAVVFSPDGTRLITVSQWQARRWLLQPQDLVVGACSRLTRNLTPQEWRQYLGVEPYRKTCPVLP
jgi:WD40 repeat protein